MTPFYKKQPMLLTPKMSIPKIKRKAKYPKVLEGKKFGEWEVLELVAPIKARCQCSCGKQKIIARWTLANGKSKSCGCVRSKYLKNLPAVVLGAKYGSWIILSIRGTREIEVKCDCGQVRVLEKWSVLNGSSSSCGCEAKSLRKEGLDFHYDDQKEVVELKKGQLFGHWEVLENPKRQVTVELICTACNTNHIRDKKSVFYGQSKSCGCKTKELRQNSTTIESQGRIKVSSQQVKVFNILLEEGFKVKLNAPILGFYADIYLMDYRIVVEYDGSGHSLFSTEEKTAEKDRIRDKKMLENGYKIFRIISKKDKIPTLNELTEYIETLLNTSKDYIKIKIS